MITSNEFAQSLIEVRHGIPGEGEIDTVNTYTRQELEKYAASRPETWLGKVNLYNGVAADLVKFDGQMVYNFGADFAVPCNDTELVRLIAERAAAPYTGTADDYKRVCAIMGRIDEIGGIHLCWA